FDPLAEPARSPGVYLWTVPNKGEEMVLYLGKAEVCLRDRLWTEFRSPRKRGMDAIPDLAELQRGVKRWLYKPAGSKKPNLTEWEKNESHFRECFKQFIQIIRVMIAPLPLNTV